VHINTGGSPLWAIMEFGCSARLVDDWPAAYGQLVEAGVTSLEVVAHFKQFVQD
jgi:hypothetical protein